ncbi:MAG: hypothetical protein ACRCTR_09650 [Actinomycetota bacterium]
MTGHRTSTTSTGTDLWEAYWATVGNEDWLVARDLLTVSPRVRAVFAQHVHLERHGLDRTSLELDWDAATEHVADEPLSSTERRLADLVVALASGGRVDLAALGLLGSWEAHVWRVLVTWATQDRVTTLAATDAAQLVHGAPLDRPC